MRDLKYHEQKLLKKVNFLQWKSDQNIREIKIMRRYHVQSRDDYIKYNKMVGNITSLTNKLKELPHDVSVFPILKPEWFINRNSLFIFPFSKQDPVRIKISDGLLVKLFNMGVLPTKKSLTQCEKLSVSAFCRRRLPVVLVRLKFCETMREAVTFVEQGHIRVGKLPLFSTPTQAHEMAMTTLEDSIDSSCEGFFF